MPEIDLPASPDAVRAACDWADALAARAGWSGPDVTRVVLAVGEAVSNAVEHGTGRVHIGVAESPDGLTVSVWDGGPGPRARSLETARLPAPSATGGRGLYMITALTESVAVSAEGGVTMTFRPRS